MRYMAARRISGGITGMITSREEISRISGNVLLPRTLQAAIDCLHGEAVGLACILKFWTDVERTTEKV
jgi:hypothetical protein